MKLTTARKRLLPLAMAALLLLLLVPAVQAWPFGDVPVGHWAYNAIQRVAYLSITAGCGGGNYCPDDYVTRAQMAGFLNNLTKAHTDDGELYIFDVDNQNDGTNDSGHGIIARSYGRDGLEGYSYGVAYADHGVYGNTNSTSSNDAGVYGYSSDSASGVYGRNTDTDTTTTTSYGVRAYSAEGYGVYAESDASGEYGGYFRGYSGVRAVAAAGGTGNGIRATSSTQPAGHFEATNAIAVAAYGGSYGVYGSSDGSYGVRGETDVANGFGLYTNDRIYTGSGCVGCTSMLIAQNGGDTPLEPGDVVAVVGIAQAPSESYARPVLLVRKADSTSSQGVVGVVEGRYVIKKGEREEVEITTRLVEMPDPEGQDEPDLVPVEDRTVKKVPVEDAHATTEPAAPGELLTIVYRGIVQVKVDAAGGIQVGDLLASASASGRATKAPATEAFPRGAIIGKALEPLANGQGLIWVLVDLQ